MSIYTEHIQTYKHFVIPWQIIERYPKFAQFMESIDKEFDQFHDFLDNFLKNYNAFETSPQFLLYLAKELNFEMGPNDFSEQERRVSLAHIVEWFKRRSSAWFFDYILKEFKIQATVTSGRDKLGILSDYGELSGNTFYTNDSFKVSSGAIYVEIDSDVADKLEVEFEKNVPIGRAFWYTLRDKFSILYRFLISILYSEVIQLFGSEWSDSDFFGTLSSDSTISEYFYLGHNDELWDEYGYEFEIGMII